MRYLTSTFKRVIVSQPSPTKMQNLRERLWACGERPFSGWRGHFLLSWFPNPWPQPLSQGRASSRPGAKVSALPPPPPSYITHLWLVETHNCDSPWTPHNLFPKNTSFPDNTGLSQISNNHLSKVLEHSLSYSGASTEAYLGRSFKGGADIPIWYETHRKRYILKYLIHSTLKSFL